MPIYNSNVYEGREAKDMLRRGVAIVASAVRKTLGAKGSNAILHEQLYPYHVITNDGISIAQKVYSSHPVEQHGVQIMQEVADRSNKEGGDGTTTAMVLADAIIEEGIASGETGISVMKSLNECVKLVEDSINKQKKDITVDEVAQAATVSAEDPELGQMLQNIYKEIGKDGIVDIEPSGTFETSFSITEGVRLRNCGYLSPYMANKGAKAEYRDPCILITKQKISTLNDVDQLFQKLSKAGINELVMFVEDIDPQVISALAYTHMQGVFKTLIIKAPNLFKDWLYEDFAAMTKATIIEPASGVTLQKCELHHLGTCGKLITTREETLVIDAKDISTHIEKIKEEKLPQYELRLAWLQTRAATLKMGANSESELKYKCLKAEDARNAAHLALEDGVVPGGGVALIIASRGLPDTIGGRILKKALKAPISQIIVNAGVSDSDSILTEISHHHGVTSGFDAKTGKIADMWEAGIVDPAKVTKSSVRTAISIAAAVLTAEIITVAPKV